MKSLARWVFRVFAKGILRRYRPTVIAVAGSIGKTATKEAIAAGLDDGDQQVRKTTGSFNAEIGVPVTIISGGRARRGWWQWMHVVFEAKKLLFWPKRPYPKILVLELGADKPGDLTTLLSVAQPSIGVLTAITAEHLEFFGDMNAITNEESQVITTLQTDQTGIVNVDEPNAAAAVKAWPGTLLRYGWSTGADIRAIQQQHDVNDRGLPINTKYTVSVGGEEVTLAIPGVLGRHQAYPILAALAVSQAIGKPLSVTVQNLRAYQPPPGRMRLFDGTAGSLIIDDSYNASPAAMQAALTSLFDLHHPGRKFAILGQMSELGPDAVRWHEQVGLAIPSRALEGLITVGPLAERIGKAAHDHGMASKRILNVPNAEAAALAVQAMLRSGDAVLIKGSRYASQLEKAVALLLEHPERDRGALVP